MKGYEYIRIELDMGDLDELNRFSGDGWRVVAVIPHREAGRFNFIAKYALLERELPAGAGSSTKS